MKDENYIKRSIKQYNLQDQDEQDVVQATLLKIHEQSLKGKIDNSRAFMRTVARNLVISTFFRNSNQRPSLRVNNNIIDTLHAEDFESENEISEQQKSALLRSAIEQLPDEDRQIFVMKKIQGLTTKEIASLTGYPIRSIQYMVAKSLVYCQNFIERRYLK